MRMRGMIAALAVVCSSVAWAGNRCVWTGLGGDGKWSNAANWQDSQQPASGNGDTVVIVGNVNMTQDIGDDFALDQLVFSNTTKVVTLGGKSLSFTTAKDGIAIAAMSSKGFTVSNDLAFANTSVIQGGYASADADKYYSCSGAVNFYGALTATGKTIYYKR